MQPRYRFHVRTIVCLLVIGAATAELQAAEAPAWRAGMAQVTITPGESMWMAGYGSRDHASEGKLTDLRAKALVLEDAAGRRAVLVTMDLIGTDRGLMQDVCGKIEKRLGVKREQIALCASHTHTGPALTGNLSPLHYLVVDPQQKQRIESYTAELQERLVGVVADAMDELEPVSVSWGSGTATFAVNRRNNRPENLVTQLRAEGRLAGPSDHDVPVLAVHDSENKLKAVVFGYACHATVLSFYQWSGDYPGFAQIDVEKEFPGCQAMFWAGCGGDQNPLPRRSVELAQDYGRQLADAVKGVLAGDMRPVASCLTAQYREIDLPLAELPTQEQIEADAKSTDRFIAARATMLLDQIARSGKLNAVYPYPVQTWQLGDDVQFVILGGEVVVDYALRLKSELRGRRTWVAGYANDVMAYIASRRVLAEGGYEGASAMIYYGLPTSWAPESEDLIIDEVRRQLAN